MKNSTKLVAAIAMLGTVVIEPVFAHHSHAMFNDAVSVELTGTVTKFSFTNPHAYLFIDVVGADGAKVGWSIEMTHVAGLMSDGIFAKTFQPGDEVIVVANPLRNGQPGASESEIKSIKRAGVETWTPPPAN